MVSRTFRNVLPWLTLVIAASASAQTTEHLIAYQGYLGLNGNPQNDSFDFKFSLLSSATLGECDTPTAECLWSDELTAVPVSGGAFSVLLGSNQPLVDSVWQADEVYLGIEVKRVTDSVYTQLAGRQRIAAVPYAARAETAKNYHITGDVVVDGAIRSRGIVPSYQAWDSQGHGDGGAGIYNDAGSYKALMLVGNNSGGGGVRRVNLYDDVRISRDLHVAGVVRSRTNCAWHNVAYSHVTEEGYTCPDGHFLAGLRTRYDGTYVDVYPGRLYCCKIGP